MLLTSCVPYKDLVNFQDASLPIGQTEEIANALEILIQPNDLLRVDVQSADPTAALPFNQGASNQNMGQLTGNNIQLFRGYLVDGDGYFDFPLVGRILAEGKTIEALQKEIREELTEYLVNPVVNARFLNFKVTMLGEVNVPGVISLPNTRITILEALGLAGDLTDYANRTNVLVIREQDGQRVYERIDLQSDEVFSSPYYYLQQNDLIYVEPIRARTATVADPAQRVISYGTALVSVVALIFAITR